MIRRWVKLLSECAVKPVGLLAIVLLVSTLTGCWDRIEVNDLSVITAAAVDKKDDQTIEFSVQVNVPAAAGKQMGDSGDGPSEKSKPLVRSAVGNTIAESLSKLQKKLSRQLFWGQCKIFIFGEALAREGVRSHLDFILREPTVRGNSNLFVSHGKAKDVLTLIPPLERNTAEMLTKTITKQVGFVMQAGQMNTMLINDTRDTAAPWIRVLPPGGGKASNTTRPYMANTAIFRRDKMIGHIDDISTQGLLWLRNEMKRSTLTVKLPETDGFVSVRVIKAHSKLVPEIKGDQWTVTFNTIAEDDIVQNTTNLNFVNPKYSKLLEEQLNKEVERIVTLALNDVQKQMRSDVIGLGEAFHRKYPAEWSRAKERWEQLYPMVKVNFDIQVHVRRLGKRLSPAGVPETEVKSK